MFGSSSEPGSSVDETNEMFPNSCSTISSPSIAPKKEGCRVIDLLDPIDAISSNRDQTKIVASGNRVLRIFAVTDEGIEISGDFRKGKKLSLMYSPSSVSWSKLRDELIATTSTNGAVVLWNAETERPDYCFNKAHERSATVVSFHRGDENILISGSTDCLINMYDIRDKVVVKCFKSIPKGTIRDLTFCMHNGKHDYFLSADDGGYVRVWDIRKGDLPVRIFQPHRGYVSSIALNPAGNSELVASGGGRDKVIKVWNWFDANQRDPFPLFQVETIAPVGRVNWRPDQPWQVASCAVVNDMSILVWDIRRPHLPVTSFYGHRDSVTDVWWNAAHPHRFVSSGKDGLLILHDFNKGDPSLDHLCDCSIDVAPDGLIAVAVNSEIHNKNLSKWDDSQRSTLQLSMPERTRRKTGGSQRRALIVARKTNVFDPFRGPVRSNMACGIPASAQNSLQPKIFAQLAENYRVSGLPIRDICQYNSRRAQEAGNAQHADMWRHLDTLLAETSYQETYDREAEEAEVQNKEKWKIYVKEQVNQGLWPYTLPEPLDIHSLLTVGTPFTIWRQFSVEDKHQRLKMLEQRRNPLKYDKTPISSSFRPNSDFYFGPGELRGASAYNNEEPACVDFLGLPVEAFELRPSITSEAYRFLANMDVDDDWLPIPEAPDVWTPQKAIAESLTYASEQGDVQLCATVAVVVGHAMQNFVPDYRTEAWLCSYLDMLDRLQLYIPMARIYKNVYIKRLWQKTNEGTYHKREFIHYTNIRSKDPLTEGQILRKRCRGIIKNGRCDKCGMVVQPPCVLCDQIIDGLSFSCEKCNHAMHMKHAVQWFWDDRFERHATSFDHKQHPFGFNKMLHLKCPVPWCSCVCGRRPRGRRFLPVKFEVPYVELKKLEDHRPYPIKANVTVLQEFLADDELTDALKTLHELNDTKKPAPGLVAIEHLATALALLKDGQQSSDFIPRIQKEIERREWFSMRCLVRCFYDEMKKSKRMYSLLQRLDEMDGFAFCFENLDLMRFQTFIRTLFKLYSHKKPDLPKSVESLPELFELRPTNLQRKQRSRFRRECTRFIDNRRPVYENSEYAAPVREELKIRLQRTETPADRAWKERRNRFKTHPIKDFGDFVDKFPYCLEDIHPVRPPLVKSDTELSETVYY